jgi:hypothetical protein
MVRAAPSRTDGDSVAPSKSSSVLTAYAANV